MLGLAAALSLNISACGSSSSGGASTVSATTTAAETISLTQAWVRTTDGALDTTMVPLAVTIKNSTANEVSIQSVTSPVAGKVEFHEMAMKDGKMVMQPKADGITIPAGETVVLKPGSDHIMLMGLKKPLPVGEEVTAEFVFSDGTTKTVTAPVKTFADGNAPYASDDSASPSMSMSMSGGSMSSMSEATTP
jgi:copper(I)-binding protein